MEKGEVYLDPSIPIEERVEDLLSKMTLDEKIGQLRARLFAAWKIFLEMFEGMPPEQAGRLFELFGRFLSEREIMEATSANYIRKHWKEDLEKEKYGLGMLSLVLRPFSPKEGAELANQIRNSLLSKPV